MPEWLLPLDEPPRSSSAQEPHQVCSQKLSKVVRVGQAHVRGRLTQNRDSTLDSVTLSQTETTDSHRGPGCENPLVPASGQRLQPRRRWLLSSFTRNGRRGGCT